VNPWRILFEWAEGIAYRLGAGLEMHEPYPDSWGVWPAVVLYAPFVWVELVFYGSSVPLSMAFLVLSYSVVTWTGMAVFGRDAWLRGGAAFSIHIGFLAPFRAYRGVGEVAASLP
jgi:hypothetical protein